MKKIIKKGMKVSFAIIAGLSTFAGLLGYTIRDFLPKWHWVKCGLIMLVAFVLLTCISCLVIRSKKHRPYYTQINGKPVAIKVGNLFLEPEWKVIPFNERFDTVVDNVIVAHNSLNGIMIDSCANDLDDMNKTISSAKDKQSDLMPLIQDGTAFYPLGRIIPYKDFLMLSFSHFDSRNRAYIGIGEYEQMLMRMWSELRTVYAARHIAIPLFGSGITTIKGISEKNYTEMLKCILCTLKRSGFQPQQGISIVLKKEVMEKIDMNEIKEDF